MEEASSRKVNIFLDASSIWTPGTNGTAKLGTRTPSAQELVERLLHGRELGRFNQLHRSIPPNGCSSYVQAEDYAALKEFGFVDIELSLKSKPYRCHRCGHKWEGFNVSPVNSSVLSGLFIVASHNDPREEVLVVVTSDPSVDEAVRVVRGWGAEVEVWSLDRGVLVERRISGEPRPLRMTRTDSPHDVAILIDGSHVFMTVKEIERKTSQGMDLDFSRFHSSAVGKGGLLIGEFHRSLQPPKVTPFLTTEQRKVIESLGYYIAEHPLRRRLTSCHQCGRTFYTYLETSTDAELIISLARVAIEMEAGQRLVLVKGDGDFVPAARFVQDLSRVQFELWGFRGHMSKTWRVRSVPDRIEFMEPFLVTVPVRHKSP